MKIQFSTDSAAFNEYVDETINDACKRQEVVRILKRIAIYIESGNKSGSVIDINGNEIGSWEL